MIRPHKVMNNASTPLRFNSGLFVPLSITYDNDKPLLYWTLMLACLGAEAQGVLWHGQVALSASNRNTLILTLSTA